MFSFVLLCSFFSVAASLVVKKTTPVIYITGDESPYICGPNVTAVNIFDIANKRWCIGKDTPVQRILHSQVYHQKKVYIIGGRSNVCPTGRWSTVKANTTEFDPKTNTFKEVPSMNLHKTQLHAFVIGNTIKAISPFSVVHTFDGVQWRNGPESSKITLQFYTAVAWKDSIWIIGGFNKTNRYTNEVQVFNIKTNKWTVGPPILTNRADGSAAVIGNTIYLCGGHKSVEIDSLYFEYLTTCERLTLNNDGSVKTKWTPIASMPSFTYNTRLVAFKGKLLALRWSYKTMPSNYPVEQYDPIKNVWTKYASFAKQPELRFPALTLIEDFPTSAMICKK